MANALQSSGANPGKQTKAAPIYTGRFFSGLYTNRSPLRDAKGNRLQEKFYGPAGDALIDGANLKASEAVSPNIQTFDKASHVQFFEPISNYFLPSTSQATSVLTGGTVDTTALSFALQLHPELWNANAGRKEYERSPHRETSDIWLRYNDISKLGNDYKAWTAQHDSVWLPAAAKLPQVRPITFDLMARCEAGSGYAT